MTGVEYERDIRALRLAFKQFKRIPHVRAFDIEAARVRAVATPDVKAILRQNAGKPACIKRWIGEFGKVLIVVVADDQRHALFGQTGGGENTNNNQRKNKVHCILPSPEENTISQQ